MSGNPSSSLAASWRGPPLQIFGADYPTGDGTCERDFIHVSELARAHVAALNRPNNGCETLALNLGTGRSYSILEVVSAIERVTGHPVPVIRGSKRQETQQPSSPMLHERSACFISSQNILIWKPSFRRHGDRARSRARSKPADFPEFSAQTFVVYAAELEFHVDPGHGAEIIDRIVLDHRHAHFQRQRDVLQHIAPDHEIGWQE
jgi:hypothetical protein